MTDWQIVQNALEHAYSTATGLRYCGMQKLYQETAEALRALQRLKQPSFWERWGNNETRSTGRHEPD